MNVELLVVPIHISDVKPFSNSDLVREKLKLYFVKGGTLSQLNAPLCDARFIVKLFSDEQFSIIFAFFRV